VRGKNFELRHLRYFVALVEEQNFERAAARLAIAQPGLSKQIANLESIVGMPLLDRTRRSVRLTTSGQMLFEEATKILSQADATLAALKRVGRGQTGRISIGYVASAAYAGTLVNSISSFRLSHPDVDLQLTELEMRQQLEQIIAGTLDFGYIRPPVDVPTGITMTRILWEPLVAVLPDKHPLSSKAEIDLAALADGSFITPRQPPDVGFHSNTVGACEEAGFRPKINATGRDFTTIVSMVAVGLGVTLAPQSIECLRLPGVRYVKLAGSRITSDVAIAHRKTESSPAVRAFIAHHKTARVLELRT
jgi:DNA-binding transcriptional LysR family regulator